MTLTGELTRSQMIRRTVKRRGWCLIFGAMGLAMTLYTLWAAQRHGFVIDPTTGIASIGLFPVATLAALTLAGWSDRWMVVRYSCDEYSFRYWNLGSEREQLRDLSDVIRVQAVYGRSGMIAYEVTFRDGGSVFLPNALPQCEELAGRLGSQCGEVLEYQKLNRDHRGGRIF